MQILDGQGELIHSLKTNRFGFYRVDGLLPGQYQVRLRAMPHVVRNVDLQRDFQFNQDLVTPAESICDDGSIIK